MILELYLKCFRKHRDRKFTFTKGINVLRGPNEQGKTTITEAILFAFFGSAALVDTLDEVVTWGEKESALQVLMVAQFEGIKYNYKRSKSGAEINFIDAEGKPQKVTGHKEVTLFSAKLIGADAKTASVLMLSSQAGLRGSLEDGPTAAANLMSRLANANLIDRILKAADQTLLLGADAPIRKKLEEAEANVAQMDATLSAEDKTPELRTQLEALSTNIAAGVEKEKAVQDQYLEADRKLQEAKAQANEWQQMSVRVTDLEKKLNNHIETQNAAIVQAGKMPDLERLAALRTEVEAAKTVQAQIDIYNEFKRLPKYPDNFWEGSKLSFEEDLEKTRKDLSTTEQRVASLTAELTTLKKQLITSDKCPTCGRASMTDEHVIEANKVTNQKINEINAALQGASANRNNIAATVKAYEAVVKVAAPFEAAVARFADKATVDLNFYPPKLVWTGAVPTMPNLQPVRTEIASLEAAERAATQAAGRVQVLTKAVLDAQSELEAGKTLFGSMVLPDLSPFQLAADAAYAALSVQTSEMSTWRAHAMALVQQIASEEAVRNGLVQRRDAELARVAEYRNDIEQVAKNNALVAKLKKLKPMITDTLWNTVLAAVSTTFSNMRGEQSVVTKDAEGFKVNGRGGSLSGSTLDVLALAIRWALSRTFLPHVSFMVLDEPAHGCDASRTSNLLGFLASMGMEQTILASHDELSEAIADNVIQLGD